MPLHASRPTFMWSFDKPEPIVNSSEGELSKALFVLCSTCNHPAHCSSRQRDRCNSSTVSTLISEEANNWPLNECTYTPRLYTPTALGIKVHVCASNQLRPKAEIEVLAVLETCSRWRNRCPSQSPQTGRPQRTTRKPCTIPSSCSRQNRQLGQSPNQTSLPRLRTCAHQGSHSTSSSNGHLPPHPDGTSAKPLFTW